MKNVLVVDDSAVMRQMIKRMISLHVQEANVIEAGNGLEAFEVLGQQSIDLVLSDINMPVMNGEQLLEKIRGTEALRTTKVLMVSTEGSAARIERLKNLGARFLRKPFSHEKLCAEIRGAFGGPNG